MRFVCACITTAGNLPCHMWPILSKFNRYTYIYYALHNVSFLITKWCHHCCHIFITRSYAAACGSAPAIFRVAVLPPPHASVPPPCTYIYIYIYIQQMLILSLSLLLLLLLSLLSLSLSSLLLTLLYSLSLYRQTRLRTPGSHSRRRDIRGLDPSRLLYFKGVTFPAIEGIDIFDRGMLTT